MEYGFGISNPSGRHSVGLGPVARAGGLVSVRNQVVRRKTVALKFNRRMPVILKEERNVFHGGNRQFGRCLGLVVRAESMEDGGMETRAEYGSSGNSIINGFHGNAAAVSTRTMGEETRTSVWERRPGEMNGKNALPKEADVKETKMHVFEENQNNGKEADDFLGWKQDEKRRVDGGTMARTTRAVVLAGGETSNPLTKVRAMPAVPIGASMLLIDIPVNNCLRSGINKMYVLTQFNSHGINSHINASYPPAYLGGPEGESWVDVLAAQQTIAAKEWYRGSADAIRKNLNELKDETRGIDPATDYVILSGSAVYSMDIANVMAHHRMKESDITICTHLIPAEKAQSKGIVKVDGVGRVIAFEEKPSAFYLERSQHSKRGEYLANMGVYIFKRDALMDLLDPKKSDVVTHIGHHVIPNAISKGMRVHAYHHAGYWQDVSTLRDYYEANLAFASPETPIKMFEVDGVRSARGSMLPPSRVQGHVIASQSLIGDGTMLVDCTIQRSVVGQSVFIGAGSVVEDSLLLGSPFWTTERLRQKAIANGERVYGVGNNCLLKKCILDENTTIGDGCTLTNAAGVQEADHSDEGYMIQDGILVVLKNAEIPAGTHI